MRRTAVGILVMGLCFVACGTKPAAVVYKYYARQGDTPEALAHRLETPSSVDSWLAYQGRDDGKPFAGGELFLIPADSLKKNRDARDALTLVASGRRKVLRGDLAQGIADLEAARALLPEDPAVLFELGVAYFEAGDYARAAEALSQAAALVPTDADVTLALASSHLAAGDAEAAIRVWGNVSSTSPEEPFARIALGEIYNALRRWPAARHSYFVYLKAAPEGLWAPFAREGVIRTAREELEDVKRAKSGDDECRRRDAAAPREAGLEP